MEEPISADADECLTSLGNTVTILKNISHVICSKAFHAMCSSVLRGVELLAVEPEVANLRQM